MCTYEEGELVRGLIVQQVAGLPHDCSEVMTRVHTCGGLNPKQRSCVWCAYVHVAVYEVVAQEHLQVQIIDLVRQLLLHRSRRDLLPARTFPSSCQNDAAQRDVSRTV